MRQPGQDRLWQRLLLAATAEVESVVRALPGPARQAAERLPVTYEPQPSEDLVKDGLEPDLLGLFVGEAMPDDPGASYPLPAQILLFLDNLWEYANHDPAAYREEVRRTYLHELGHYLGLDEDDLARRDLD